MNKREYWTKHFKEQLEKLNEDDLEVLENTIKFEEASDGIANLF